MGIALALLLTPAGQPVKVITDYYTNATHPCILANGSSCDFALVDVQQYLRMSNNSAWAVDYDNCRVSNNASYCEKAVPMEPDIFVEMQYKILNQSVSAYGEAPVVNQSANVTTVVNATVVNDTSDKIAPMTEVTNITDAYGNPQNGNATVGQIYLFFNTTDNVHVNHSECNLDGVDWFPCQSPIVINKPEANQTRTMEIRSVDDANNAEETPEIFVWRPAS